MFLDSKTASHRQMKEWGWVEWVGGSEPCKKALRPRQALGAVFLTWFECVVWGICLAEFRFEL